MCKYSKEKDYKIYDNQLNEYSSYGSIEGLYIHLLEDYCECGEGYDILDEKDGKMKCWNCYQLNHLEEIGIDEMVGYVENSGYTKECEIEEE